MWWWSHLKGKSEKTPFPKREILITKSIYKSIIISLVMRLTYTIFSQNVRMQSVLFLLNNYLKNVSDAIFFDNKGHIMQIPVPESKTVIIHSTKRIVIKYMNKLYKSRRLKTVMKYNLCIWLWHDNAPAHIADIVTEYLEAEQVTVLPDLWFSPDLAAYDFFLFPEVKFHLSGKR